MRWTTKARIQRLLSSVPLGPQLYYLAQKRMGGFRHFTIDSKVAQGSGLLECLADLHEPLTHWSAVEIGTGWAPILPMLFWLNGQEQCDTYDNQQLLKDSLVVESARQFVALYRSVPGLSPDENQRAQFHERLNVLENLVADGASSSQIMGACKIRYHAPVDAASTGLASESVDVVYSNTTLEHAREDEISALLRESYRIIRPGGYMLHLIDLSDHFAHSDQQISAINFLQFSESEFSQYNSRFLYQNRLREPRWRQIIQDQNFEIICWRPHVDSRALTQLSTMQLDPAFAGLSPEELCVSSIHVIAQRPHH
jgi:SAM-dependent methyltransferase